MRTEEPAAGDRYHHGNLRAALLDSALEVLSESGVAGFSMREAARRAGVSQSAPKHHFGDARGLLGALATEYVAFARDNRALFDLMWRMTQFDFNDPDLIEQKHRALRALDRGLRGQDAQLPDNDVWLAVWSFPSVVGMRNVTLVHGFWHGSWCWSLVSEQLAGRGLNHGRGCRLAT
jgi:AcrR family transcriptional regulator